MRKKNVRRLVMIAVTLMIVILCLRVTWQLFYGWRYDRRYKVCEPEILIEDLRENLEIKLPPILQTPMAAKTRPIDFTVHYILKFSVNPDQLESLKAAFPEPLILDFSPYDHQDDRRAEWVWPPPSCFTRPIRDGLFAIYDHINGMVFIYVDQGDPVKTVVYLNGYYLD